MPCYRCGARQTDPARGASPWKKGVKHGSQVLICPDCQRSHTWTADLDSCPACGSTVLARALGVTTCRECGWSDESEASGNASGQAPGLAEDVGEALARLWGRDRSP
jgi:ribosomal protein L37AE/L43A